MTEVATGCSPEPGETEVNKDIQGPISPDDGQDFSNGRNRMPGNKGEMKESQTKESQGNRSQWAPHRQRAPQEMLKVSLKAMGIYPRIIRNHKQEKRQIPRGKLKTANQY